MKLEWLGGKLSVHLSFITGGIIGILLRGGGSFFDCTCCFQFPSEWSRFRPSVQHRGEWDFVLWQDPPSPSTPHTQSGHALPYTHQEQWVQSKQCHICDMSRLNALLTFNAACWPGTLCFVKGSVHLNHKKIHFPFDHSVSSHATAVYSLDIEISDAKFRWI